MRIACSSSLDPNLVKQIITEAEDIRVSLRLSELSASIEDKTLLEIESRKVMRHKIDIMEGEQCARDFFVCLKTNVAAWPDVCSLFNFKLRHSTTCLRCSHTNMSETSQLYVEIQVPLADANLNDCVEELLNQSELVKMKCEDGCQHIVQAEKKSQLVCGFESNFLVYVLSRGVGDPEDYQINNSRISSINDLFVK